MGDARLLSMAGNQVVKEMREGTGAKAEAAKGSVY
jgi:hypothetical protein